MKYDKPKFLTASESALCVEFGDSISKDICAAIRTFDELIANSNIPGIKETVPTYRSIIVHYSPTEILYDEIIKKLSDLADSMNTEELIEGKLIEVPVVYGGEYGPDLKTVAEHNDLTVEEVIKIHTAPEYLIYMLGFTPGFAYMGGMDEAIATPRLAAPRVKIPGGSVGIAGSQTGIYPIDSPGGWQLIGRTPLTLFDPQAEKTTLFDSGQRVKFYQISEDEYIKIKSQGTEKV